MYAVAMPNKKFLVEAKTDNKTSLENIERIMRLSHLDIQDKEDLYRWDYKYKVENIINTVQLES